MQVLMTELIMVVVALRVKKAEEVDRPNSFIQEANQHFTLDFQYQSAMVIRVRQLLIRLNHLIWEGQLLPLHRASQPNLEEVEVLLQLQLLVLEVLPLHQA